MAGTHELGLVPWSKIPSGKDLWLLGVAVAGVMAVVNFNYAHIGAKFSLSSGSGVVMEDLDVRGYEQLVLGIEDEEAVGYKPYFSSEAFWFQGGAPAALTDSRWITKVIYKRCKFESTPIMIYTGGGYWEGSFSPEHANPGVKEVVVEDNYIWGHGGFDVFAIQYGDCTFRRNRFRNDVTVASLERFQAKFPNNRWNFGTGLSQTGNPIQQGLRHCIRVGRINYPYNGNDMYYRATNGTVRWGHNVYDYIVSDVLPRSSKFSGKHDQHAVDVRGTDKFVIEDGNVIHNCMDLAFWRDPAYALHEKVQGVLNGEPFYAKAKITFEPGAKIIIVNFGPCEGGAPTKPAFAGSAMPPVEFRRDPAAAEQYPFIMELLDKMPSVKDRSGRVMCERGQIPNIEYMMIGKSPNTEWSGLRGYGFRAPSIGARELVVTWDSHPYPSDVKVWAGQDESAPPILDVA